LIATIKNNIQNIPGRRLRGRFIVFESDDWGSLRIPSPAVMEELEQSGLNLSSNPFNYLDALETDEDLISLFDLLAGFKDFRGNHPSITANCVVANPDFEKIRASGFSKYHWESIETTYAKSIAGRNVYRILQEGIRAGVMWPQLHGREHLNNDQWLSALRSGDAEILKAFTLGVFAIDYKNAHSQRNNFTAAFDFSSAAESEAKEKIIEDAVSEFKRLFNYQPKSFIAPCYVWHPSLEGMLNNNGIMYIQGINYQFAPDPGKPKYRKIMHTQGQENKHGQRYFVRNAFFEPALNNNLDWVENCMQRIKIAFFWGKPAIIGTHRLNFAGSISKANREKTHRLLAELLKRITQTWPDVEFTTTDRLGDLY
jgi:hypothetical protein